MHALITHVRSVRSVLVAAGLGAGLALSGCAGTRESKMFDRPAETGDVSGRMIVTISDADMMATTLADERLATPPDGARDLLTVIGLPIVGDQAMVAQTPVSNSMLGPPQALSVNRAGTMAFVCESRGQVPSGATSLKEMPQGTLLQMVSIADPMNPSMVSSVYVGPNPSACDVSPDGTLVAVITPRKGERREQLVIVPVEGSALGQPMEWDLLGINDDAVATSVAWSPDGKLLAVCLPSRDEVAFYEFARLETGLAISPCGEPVKVGKYPFHGRWTPDGKQFITTDLQWQNNSDDYLLHSPPGTLSVVSVGHGEHPVHSVVSSATVGVSPEGLAISPDGKYVVTANLERSFLPEGDSRLQSGSLTLLTLGEGGKLEARGEYDLQGMPEGISFDANGNFVVVTLFRSLDPRAMDGELAFWRLNPHGGADKSPALEQAKFWVGVGRGPHGVLVVR